jgi:hypothetical protein
MFFFIPKKRKNISRVSRFLTRLRHRFQLLNSFSYSACVVKQLIFRSDRANRIRAVMTLAACKL